jgi:naphthoate synthase/2-ketocyclohexanecarboxyl-CoA hydrolase
MAWTEWKKAEVGGCKGEEIIYEKKYRDKGGGVARITFNRPERMNAFTEIGIDELCLCLDNASGDPAIGVVVISSVGDHFGTGGDVKWEAGPSFRYMFIRSTGYNRIIRFCRKPIIAAVKGYCIGGHHHLAYFCDFTIAADNAVFGQNGPRVGSPAHGFVVSYLARVIGSKKAREIWMLCRRYTAQEALQMGLANKVVPLKQLDKEVDQWCDELLDISPTCLSLVKASFDGDIDYMDGDFGRYLMQMAPDFFDGDEVKEAQQAFFEKRTPNFWKDRMPEDADR